MPVFDLKKYVDIPIGHRQHLHDGHCAQLHGHNWSFELTFAADETDKLGFVVDFGKLKFIKTWIEEVLDHSFMLAEDDWDLQLLFDRVNGMEMVKVLHIPNSSAEGLAAFIYQRVNTLLRMNMEKDVAERNLRVTQVQLWEDSYNSVVYFE